MTTTPKFYCCYYSSLLLYSRHWTSRFDPPLLLQRPTTSQSSPNLIFSSSYCNLCRINCGTNNTTSTRFLSQTTRRSNRKLTVAAASMLHQNPFVSDLIATGFSGCVALSVLRVFEETAKRRIFDQKLNRKLVHISIGLVFMLCWPLFSSGRQGAVLAALIPAINVIKMLLVGSGILKDEAMVKSMSRFGDRRELLKGPLYYATAITLACAIYWRSSPIGIAAISNLSAGDGMADIVGRRFGNQKIPYNRNKSVAGSVAMALSGFLASVVFMYYFASFGYVQKSWGMVSGFFLLSLASAIVESLPISTKLDDNLTVTVTSLALGILIF